VRKRNSFKARRKAPTARANYYEAIPGGITSRDEVRYHMLLQLLAEVGEGLRAGNRKPLA
jgi:hypothetical protein